MSYPQVAKLCEWGMNTTENCSFCMSGLSTSARAMVLAMAFRQMGKSFVVVCDDEDKGIYLYNDLCKVSSDVFYFPSSYKDNRFAHQEQSNVILRTEVLARLSSQKPYLIVASVDGLAERVPDAKTLKSNTLNLSVGESVEADFIVETLSVYGFEQVDFVYAPGQFSIRGSIVDVFSFTNDYPYRIDLFGIEIDSIRTFDVEKQLSIEKVEAISIVPDLQKTEHVEKVSCFSLFSKDTVLYFSDLNHVVESADVLFTDNIASFFLNGEELRNNSSRFPIVEFKNSGVEPCVDFHISPQPLFHKNFDLVSQQLLQLQSEGYRLFIASDSKKQTDRIAAIFEDRGDDISFVPIENTVHEGFIDHDLKICFFTDHQIFDRFHKYGLKTEHAKNGKTAMMLKELNQIQIGDYIVHVDHGIGRFGGLLKADINGKQQEVIKLVYKNDDVIFVSIHGLHRISKYKGKDGEPPIVNKLGTGAWERMKERTKKKVKDIARDLIQLYAKRMAEKGFPFSPDGYLQHELEASFLYEDTPDQLKVTAEVKRDMESEVPMDRLVCGDVGFGKTEIAVRAAFKAVTDGKQVAVLVPTTVLAFQHYKTFKERLKDFPCRVDYLSRMRKSSDVKGILSDNASGKVDILIGTHRLIGKDIKFNDLGLLIIDEEQKFGVSVKEKLKQLKVNVDTLTLTATPIPRTLQFSLMGARDLSVITTPPPNRYPIYTELHVFDEEVIKDAINNELKRNGQVFFVHNRVQSIGRISEMLKRMMPELRIAVVHGQMPPEKLEETILDFIDYEYDVLIATTVIESGIDIPNVNTIIINNAQSFGLTDLHQLRGRVGRSNRKAYCYLLSPPVKDLTDDARRRLQAIESFSELGSGFNIAMQDLDIRGAGNMLGAEQSGFIADIGYETYQKILEEAVGELKNEEFSSLYQNDQQSVTFVSDCFLESDLELMFPAHYIENVAERMSLYRDLDNIDSEEQLEKFQSELEDRFGKIPPQTEDLILMVRLRWLAQSLGFEKLILKNGRMTAYLVSNVDSAYYNSDTFGEVLRFIAEHPNMCKLRDQNGKRSIVIQNVKCVSESLKILQSI